jgi:hypothetical protein
MIILYIKSNAQKQFLSLFGHNLTFSFLVFYKILTVTVIRASLSSRFVIHLHDTTNNIFSFLYLYAYYFIMHIEEKRREKNSYILLF